MKRDLIHTSVRHVTEVKNINRELTEKALRMRCLAYLTQMKSDLLTETLYHMKVSKSVLTKEIEERVRAQMLLTEERNFINAVLDNASVIVIVTDRGGKIIRANEALQVLVGKSFDKIAEKPLWSMFETKEEVGIVKKGFDEILDGAESVDIETPIMAYNNEVRYVAWTFTMITGAKGDVGYVVLTGIDQTKQRLAEVSLRLNAKVFESTLEGIVVTDNRGVIQSVNPAFAEITGYTALEAIGHTSALLKSGKHDSGFYKTMWDTIASGGQWRGEIWNKRKDGSLYPQLLSISAIKNEEGEVANYVGVFTDIEERKKREDLISFMAYHDALTELPNRQLFNDRFELEIAHARRRNGKLGVLFLDLDHFKKVNDTLGHDIGDGLLKEVANRLQKVTREADTISRLGGDEFTALIPEIDDERDLAFVAEKILDALKPVAIIGGHELSITVSIGAAMYPDDSGQIKELLKLADDAMYVAKVAGRNTYKLASSLAKPEAS
jgi:diguanylate cyclase (GGDEF)-like protein/PAS domain S-box-containing protein